MLSRLPFGPAPTLLLVLLVLSIGWLGTHPPSSAVDVSQGDKLLRVWVFARTPSLPKPPSSLTTKDS